MIVNTHRTGDINLSAACMSLGISPVFPEPVEVHLGSDGRDYRSFRLESISECGRHSTMAMSEAWSYPSQFNKTHPSHPFSCIMEFVRMAGKCRTLDDYSVKASEYLGISVDAVRSSIKKIDQVNAASPESPVAYICCFILNKMALIKWTGIAIPKIFASSNSGTYVLLDGNLPKSKQKALIAYL